MATRKTSTKQPAARTAKKTAARAAVLAELPDDVFPGGAKADWWLKAVQLDLEAKGLVTRTKTSPLRLHRK